MADLIEDLRSGAVLGDTSDDAATKLDRAFGLGVMEAHDVLRTNSGAKRIYDCALTAVAALIEERDRYHAALTKIDAIRNSIIGFQNVGWSDHIYPLVAALHEAGFEGQGYKEASTEIRTMLAAERQAEAAQAEIAVLREALARAQSWHQSEDKALSKSGRNDADYHWRRLQHREQLGEIRAALPAAEYDAAWDRINARAPAADDDPS